MRPLDVPPGLMFLNYAHFPRRTTGDTAANLTLRCRPLRSEQPQQRIRHRTRHGARLLEHRGCVHVLPLLYSGRQSKHRLEGGCRISSKDNPNDILIKLYCKLLNPPTGRESGPDGHTALLRDGVRGRRLPVFDTGRAIKQSRPPYDD